MSNDEENLNDIETVLRDGEENTLNDRENIFHEDDGDILGGALSEGEHDEDSILHGDPEPRQSKVDQRLAEVATDLDDKYGAEHRDDAFAAAEKKLRADGYTADDPPLESEVHQVLRDEYHNLKDVHLTMDEAVERMQEEGRI